MRRVAAGMGAAVRGLRGASNNPDVRRAYSFFALGLLCLSLLANVAGLAFVLHLTSQATQASGLASAGWWLLRIVGGLAVLLLAPILSVLLANLLFPLFADIPFMAGMRALAPRRAEELGRLPGLAWHAALAINLRRLLAFLAISAACVGLGWIPVVGPLLAFPLSFFVAARSLGWELLDPYLSRLSLDLRAQRALLRAHSPEVLGFGLISAALLSLPLVGPFFFGVLQSASARLVLDVIERQGRSTS